MSGNPKKLVSIQQCNMPLHYCQFARFNGEFFIFMFGRCWMHIWSAISIQINQISGKNRNESNRISNLEVYHDASHSTCCRNVSNTVLTGLQFCAFFSQFASNKWKSRTFHCNWILIIESSRLNIRMSQYLFLIFSIFGDFKGKM